MPPKGKISAAKKVEVSKGSKRKLQSESDGENNSSDDETTRPKRKGSSGDKKDSKANKRKATSESEEENSDEEKSQSDKSDDEKSDKSDNESDKDEDEDENEEPPNDTKSSKTIARATKTVKVVKKVVKKVKVETNGTTTEKKKKVITKAERLEEARQAYKWWEAAELADGANWVALEHPGVYFPPAYTPLPANVKLYYDGKPVDLTPEQEEIASFFAAISLEGPQLGVEKTAKVFSANFFDDFKATLSPGHVIKKFALCDFSHMRLYLDEQRALKKVASDDAKLAIKTAKAEIALRMGYCLIDGRTEKMGNYSMEPPGLFRGRGEHPLTGKLKHRTFSESVSLNLSEDSCVPISPLPGHAWRSVQHDPAVTWLSSWNENVQNQIKYVMLSASSSFKGKSDMDKYGKAIKLVHCIDKVRANYTAKIRQTKDRAARQLGTAMWVIDKLALRVGGEKGEDEADTVGCCSLRVEHFTFKPEDGSHVVELKFLGKDSMQYLQDIDFSKYGAEGETVYDCIKSFCDKKTPDQQVFETLSPTNLNEQLNELMKGLSAKVFRTFNASITLEKQLPTEQELEGLTVAEKITRYNEANREVAILCNHQKTVSKAVENNLEVMKGKVEDMIQQKKDLERWAGLLKKKSVGEIPKKELREDDKDIINDLKERLEKAKTKKEKAKTDADKISSAQLVDDAKAAIKEDALRRFKDKHRFATQPTLAAVQARIEKWETDIKKANEGYTNRNDNKEVSLGTSKINYMDPRISVAWCKRCEVPIDKVFTKTLRDKFNWAMAVSPDWKFI